MHVTHIVSLAFRLLAVRDSVSFSPNNSGMEPFCAKTVNWHARPGSTDSFGTLSSRVITVLTDGIGKSRRGRRSLTCRNSGPQTFVQVNGVTF